MEMVKRKRHNQLKGLQKLINSFYFTCNRRSGYYRILLQVYPGTVGQGLSLQVVGTSGTGQRECLMPPDNNRDSKREVSDIDCRHLAALRKNIVIFMVDCAERFEFEGSHILDIAPQDHSGASPFFTRSLVDTMDIDPNSGATYIADLCATNTDLIPGNKYDFIVCTEVLEHTLDPFSAVNEMHRILKPGGFCFVSTPFNLRIHGPLPDCWRFTVHGLKQLFRSFDVISISELEDSERFLMPIQYTSIFRKKSRESGFD